MEYILNQSGINNMPSKLARAASQKNVTGSHRNHPFGTESCPLWLPATLSDTRTSTASHPCGEVTVIIKNGIPHNRKKSRIPNYRIVWTCGFHDFASDGITFHKSTTSTPWGILSCRYAECGTPTITTSLDATSSSLLTNVGFFANSSE